MTDIYKALADETRRLILDELVIRDEQTLFEICVRLAARGVHHSRQAVSQHLALLESAGLLATERRGRQKFHMLDTSPLAEIPLRWPINQGVK